MIFGGLLLGLDVATLYQPLVGPLRTALPLLLFFFTLPLIAATLEGANQPRWADLKMDGRDLAGRLPGRPRCRPCLALPLLIFVAIRGNHHLLDAGSGPLGFLGARRPRLADFPAAAAAARHHRRLRPPPPGQRLGKHFRFMAADGGAGWWVAAFTFGALPGGLLGPAGARPGGALPRPARRRPLRRLRAGRPAALDRHRGAPPADRIGRLYS